MPRALPLPAAPPMPVALPLPAAPPVALLPPLPPTPPLPPPLPPLPPELPASLVELEPGFELLELQASETATTEPSAAARKFMRSSLAQVRERVQGRHLPNSRDVSARATVMIGAMVWLDELDGKPLESKT